MDPRNPQCLNQVFTKEKKNTCVNPLIRETVPPDHDKGLQPLTGNAGSEFKIFKLCRIVYYIHEF